MSRAGEQDKRDDKDAKDAARRRSEKKPAPTLTHLSDHWAVDSSGQAYSVAPGQEAVEVEGVPGVRAVVVLTPVDVQVVEVPKPEPQREREEREAREAREKAEREGRPQPTPMPAER